MIDTGETLAEPVEPLPLTPKREPLRKRLFIGSAYAFAATVLGQVFALLTSIVYARVLGAYDLGVLAIYAQVAALAVALGGLGLSTPITRFVAQLRADDPAKLERFLSTVITVVIGATIVVSAGLFLTALVGLYGNAELIAMIELVSAFLVLNSLTTIGSAVLQGFQEIRWLSVVGIVSEALTVPVMFVSLSALGLVGAAAGGVLLVGFSTAALFGPAWRALRRSGVRIRFRIHVDSIRALVRYSVPLLASGVIVRSALLFQSGFLVLAFGYLDTGLFRAASTVARILAFVPTAISVPLLPALSELYATATEDRSKANLTTILRISTFVGFPFAVTVGLLSQPVISLFFGSEFSGATTLAFVLVVAGFVDVINAVAVNAMLGEGRTWTILLLDVGQSAILVVSTVVFVLSFGLLGVGFAALLTDFAYAVAVLTLLARARRINAGRIRIPVGLAAGGFAASFIAVATLDALGNLYVGVALIAVFTVVSWGLLEGTERRLLVGLARDALPRRRPTPPPGAVRILEVSPYGLSEVSGVTAVVLGLSQRFGRRRHKVVVAAPGPVPANPPSGIAYLPIASRGRLRDFQTSARLAVWMWRHRDEWDVVHAHQGHPVTVTAAALARVLRRPVVTTFHLLPPEPRGARKWLQRWSVRLVAATSTERVYVSEHTKHEYRRPGVVIRNGIDVAGIRSLLGDRETLRRELGLEGCVVAFSGRVAAIKGYPDLVRAIQKVRASGCDVRLLVTGRTPVDEQEFMSRLVRESGLGSAVKELGDREDHIRLLAAADVFALPSYREGLPISLLEAIACGLPVVATEVGGIPEVVEDGVDGFLVPPGDVDVLAAKIQGLCGAPGLRAAMGRHALQSAAAFDADRVADAYVAVLTKPFREGAR